MVLSLASAAAVTEAEVLNFLVRTELLERVHCRVDHSKMVIRAQGF